MSGSVEPTSSGRAAQDKAGWRHEFFWMVCGMCAYQGGSSAWKAWSWPELRLFAWGNVVLLILFCFAMYAVMKSLQRCSKPVPWLKGWAIWVGFFGISFLLASAGSLVPLSLYELLIPLPERADFPDQAALSLAQERAFSGWKCVRDFVGTWAFVFGLAFLQAAQLFKASPGLAIPKPPPSPPVAREEWWKKYY
jgi:hypothetical protein